MPNRLPRYLTMMLFLALLPAAPLNGPMFAAEASELNRPNIIFLMADDQRWDTLGCMGNDVVHTPNLDRLARDGVVFDNMFVTTSICCTNRACVLTGQYARRHGIWNFQKTLTPQQLGATYCGMLQSAGYDTGFIGKYGVGQPPRDFFDFDLAWPGQGKYFVNVPETPPTRFDFRADSPGKRTHLTTAMGEQVLEFLDQCDSKRPFTLSVSFKAAHVQDSYNLADRPFQPDPALEKSLYNDQDVPLPPTASCEAYESLPKFLKNSEARMRWAVRFWGPDRYQQCVKDYYRLVSGIDVQIGRLLEKLEQRGLADRTVIIYTGDNGFFLGEHGLAGKWFPHEESIRVPLVVYDPRQPDSRRGMRRKEMVLSIDIAPTICDLAGVEPPDAMQGQSLVPLLNNEDTSWRKEWLYEHLFAHPRIPENEGIRTDRWKYMVFQVDPPWEGLYDLTQDPGETRNLANDAQYESVLTEMRQKLALWRENAK
jgi:arylsulfatase A-like enzyme